MKRPRQIVHRRHCDMGLSCDRVQEMKADCGCRLRTDKVGADFKFCRYHFLNQPAHAIRIEEKRRQVWARRLAKGKR